MQQHPHGAELVRWARDHVRQRLGGESAVAPSGAWCDEPGATFVTLRWTSGRLHGCIGSLTARRPILADVAENALAAALRDPRSRPLRLHELDQIDVELSILSPQTPIAFTDEASALAAIRRGVDGIIFLWRHYCATFLPAMWDQLPDVERFMAELKRKAGLDEEFWDEEVRLYRYEADKHIDAAPTGERRNSS